MITKPTQNELILQHLYSIDEETGKRRHLTQYTSLGLYRISSLTSRISELRRNGYKIKSIRRRDPTGRHFVEYRMGGRAVS